MTALEAQDVIATHNEDSSAPDCSAHTPDDTTPLVGPVESISVLDTEYSGNPAYTDKLKALSADYSRMRRTRGDGNCFYRSALFGLLEHMVVTSATGAGRQEAQDMLERLADWKGKLMAQGYQPLVFEDAQDLLEDLLRTIASPEGASLAELEMRLSDATVSSYILMYLRFITASELLRRPEHFLPFILGLHDGVTDVRDFCQRMVEPMGEEADHIHIVALSDGLAVPVRIVYLDSSGGFAPVTEAGTPAAVSSHTFVPEGLPEARQAPVMTLLYRPGHYDLLYV